MSLSPDQIHRSALVIDTHADTPQRFADESWSFLDPIGSGHLNLEAARAGNLSAEFFAIWPEPTQWRGRFAHRTLQLIDAVHQQVRLHPQHLQLCLTTDDILAAHATGRFAVLLGIEGGHAIENSLAVLRIYHQLGVRYMTLTWANHNDWADSSGEPPLHNGLTSFGRDVVREMNRLGMMVDVSHLSDDSLADVLATTRAPVIASHSSARALTAAPRNLTDEQIRAIAGTGGAVMVNFYPAFIDENWRSAWNALTPERHAALDALQAHFDAEGKPVPYAASNAIDREFSARIPRPPLRSLIDHFDHILGVAGPDHVGIGTDFDGISALPEGIDSAADLPKVTEALAARGHSEDTLRKLLGGNLLRVMREVETGADL